MKIYKKEECNYVDGYIVHGDDIVAIDNDVVDLLNMLDTDIQQKVWSIKNDVEPVRADEFVRISEHSAEVPVLHAKTPTLDAKIEESLKFVEELDNMEIADKVNSYCEMLSEAFHFVDADYAIDNEMQGRQHRFDLPVVGNPLDYDIDSLHTLVTKLHMMKLEDVENGKQIEGEGN